MNTWTAASSVSSYAYCAKPKKTPSLTPVGATVPGTDPAADRTEVTATCTGKRTMAGGGFGQVYVLQVGGGTFGRGSGASPEVGSPRVRP